jgi:hypothetical protein
MGVKSEERGCFAQAKLQSDEPITRISDTLCCAQDNVKRIARFASSVLSDLQSLSTQGHTGDALAFVGEKLRLGAHGHLTRRSPNGKTQPHLCGYLFTEYIGLEKRTGRTETSQ